MPQSPESKFFAPVKALIEVGTWAKVMTRGQIRKTAGSNTGNSVVPTPNTSAVSGAGVIDANETVGPSTGLCYPWLTDKQNALIASAQAKHLSSSKKAIDKTPAHEARGSLPDLSVLENSRTEMVVYRPKGRGSSTNQDPTVIKKQLLDSSDGKLSVQCVGGPQSAINVTAKNTSAAVSQSITEPNVLSASEVSSEETPHLSQRARKRMEKLKKLSMEAKGLSAPTEGSSGKHPRSVAEARQLMAQTKQLRTEGYRSISEALQRQHQELESTIAHSRTEETQGEEDEVMIAQVAESPATRDACRAHLLKLAKLQRARQDEQRRERSYQTRLSSETLSMLQDNLSMVFSQSAPPDFTLALETPKGDITSWSTRKKEASWRLAAKRKSAARFVTRNRRTPIKGYSRSDTRKTFCESLLQGPGALPSVQRLMGLSRNSTGLSPIIQMEKPPLEVTSAPDTELAANWHLTSTPSQTPQSESEEGKSSVQAQPKVATPTSGLYPRREPPQRANVARSVSPTLSSYQEGAMEPAEVRRKAVFEARERQVKLLLKQLLEEQINQEAEWADLVEFDDNRNLPKLSANFTIGDLKLAEADMEVILYRRRRVDRNHANWIYDDSTRNESYGSGFRRKYGELWDHSGETLGEYLANQIYVNSIGVSLGKTIWAKVKDDLREQHDAVTNSYVTDLANHVNTEAADMRAVALELLVKGGTWEDAQWLLMELEETAQNLPIVFDLEQRMRTYPSASASACKKLHAMKRSLRCAVMADFLIEYMERSLKRRTKILKGDIAKKAMKSLVGYLDQDLLDARLPPRFPLEPCEEDDLRDQRIRTGVLHWLTDGGQRLARSGSFSSVRSSVQEQHLLLLKQNDSDKRRRAAKSSSSRAESCNTSVSQVHRRASSTAEGTQTLTQTEMHTPSKHESIAKDMTLKETGTRPKIPQGKGLAPDLIHSPGEPHFTTCLEETLVEVKPQGRESLQEQLPVRQNEPSSVSSSHVEVERGEQVVVQRESVVTQPETIFLPTGPNRAMEEHNASEVAEHLCQLQSQLGAVTILLQDADEVNCQLEQKRLYDKEKLEQAVADQVKAAILAERTAKEQEFARRDEKERQLHSDISKLVAAKNKATEELQAYQDAQADIILAEQSKREEMEAAHRQELFQLQKTSHLAWKASDKAQSEEYQALLKKAQELHNESERIRREFFRPDPRGTALNTVVPIPTSTVALAPQAEAPMVTTKSVVAQPSGIATTEKTQTTSNPTVTSTVERTVLVSLPLTVPKGPERVDTVASSKVSKRAAKAAKRAAKVEADKQSAPAVEQPKGGAAGGGGGEPPGDDDDDDDLDEGDDSQRRRDQGTGGNAGGGGDEGRSDITPNELYYDTGAGNSAGGASGGNGNGGGDPASTGPSKSSDPSKPPKNGGGGGGGGGPPDDQGGSSATSRERQRDYSCNRPVYKMADGYPYLTIPGSKSWEMSEIAARLKGLFPKVKPSDYKYSLDHAFHAELPFPWNKPVVRMQEGHKTADWFKLQLNGMLLFDGRRENYASFRSSFLHAVHIQPMDISHKCTALIAAVQKVPRCSEIIRMPDHDIFGYQTLIMNLESFYGGIGNLIYEERANLKDERRYPRLNVANGNLHDLEKLAATTRKYVVILTTQGRVSDTIGTDFTNLISEKISTSDDMFYSQWINSTNRPRCGLSMIDWLNEIKLEKQAKDKERTLDNTKSTGSPQPTKTTSSSSTTKPRSTWSKPASSKPYSSARRAFNFHDSLSDQEINSGDSEDEEEEGGDDNWFVDDNDQPCHAFFVKTARKADICPFCSTEHWIVNCPKYAKWTPVERRKQLFEKKRCYRCLGTGHGLAKCQSKRFCKSCKRTHHTSLHGSDPKSGATDKANQASELQEETQAEHSPEQTTEVLDQ